MEEGKLTLNDPLSLYLDEYQNIDQEVTIKQLLNHTSGIYNYTDNEAFFEDVLNASMSDFIQPEEILDLYVLEPLFIRGAQQEYSNTNYILLGMIISEIAERPFWLEINDRFDLSNKYPSISIPPFDSNLDILAHLWADVGTGVLTDIQEFGIDLTGLFSSAGAAGAYAAKPKDLNKWIHDLYSGKILKSSSMDSLFTYPNFILDEEANYGLGVLEFNLDCGIKMVGHSGGIIYTAYAGYVEAHDLSITVMTNDGNGIEEIGGVIGIAIELACAYEEYITTSTSDLKQTSVAKIFPNPTTGILNIEMEALDSPIEKIEIYGELGRLLSVETFTGGQTNKVSINCFEKFDSGVYILKIYTGDSVVTERVVKVD